MQAAGTVKLSSLAAFSPPAAAARSLIPSLKFSGTLPQNGRILLNLTVPAVVPSSLLVTCLAISGPAEA